MIIELHLRVPAYWYPGWHPGVGGTRDQFAFEVAKGHKITREGPVYVVEQEHAGERHRCEVPVANVKCAVWAPEPIAKAQPAQLQKGGRR